MNTKEIMELSLKLAGLKEVPQDSATYVSGDNIRKVLFGIDAGVSELLLAKQLGCDAVIAHHPVGGTAAINFHQVFKRHIQQMVLAGVPLEEAEKVVAKKLEQLEVEAHTRNYAQAVDVAKLLKMPYMNIHTPLDEVGRRIMSERINKRIRKNSTVQDVVSALKGLSEFKNAITEIKIRLGKTENPTGKVVVSHGAGTNGGYEIAKTYFKHGVGTLIYIHISAGDLEKLQADDAGNLIVTGHIASDSVGINPLIKELKKRNISVTSIGVIPS
ncbi:MAG: Nif3-like dinuclear metal center hexameric protein [Candidatus Bathyarchaeota archaeon]|nr:Nif3-like dinuclear metal center hexameric protein [Candidatus Bathyarchaeota archaeon]